MDNKKVLTVINVGQGDCMILRPKRDCVLFDKTYIIDTGDGTTDFTKDINPDEQISLVLTHSHQDHIGGIVHLLPRINQIKEIILPFYYNEIILIAKAINNLLGINNIAYNSLPIKQLNEHLINNTLIRNIANHKPTPKIILGYEGYPLCTHFIFLNPPILDATRKDFSTEDINKLTALFEEPFAHELNLWLNMRLQHKSSSDTPRINDDYIFPVYSLTEIDTYIKGFFVYSFLKENFEKMLKFTRKPTISNLSPIVNSLNLTSNQASLVFRFDTGKEKILFTGDADTSVFKRIISNGKEKKLRSEILKVPHHGSKTGLNDRIIKIINPECAIICHSNKKFGRAKDTHPNTETIKLLEKNHVRIYVTNDVIKNNVVRINKEFGFPDTFEIVDKYRLY